MNSLAAKSTHFAPSKIVGTNNIDNTNNTDNIDEIDNTDNIDKAYCKR